jgi:hypothetical protein
VMRPVLRVRHTRTNAKPVQPRSWLLLLPPPDGALLLRGVDVVVLVESEDATRLIDPGRAQSRAILWWPASATQKSTALLALDSGWDTDRPSQVGTTMPASSSLQSWSTQAFGQRTRGVIAAAAKANLACCCCCCQRRRTPPSKIRKILFLSNRSTTQTKHGGGGARARPKCPRTVDRTID